MVNTYQPINSTALEILALLRDQAEYDQVTISATAVGNALCATRETAARNMRNLVDMNLLEVIVPQKGALAATYRVPAAAASLLDALDGVKKPIATRLDKDETLCAPADGVIVLSDGVWDVSNKAANPPLHVRVCGRAQASISGNICAIAADYAQMTTYEGVEAQATDWSCVRALGGVVHLYGRSVGVSPWPGPCWLVRSPRRTSRGPPSWTRTTSPRGTPPTPRSSVPAAGLVGPCQVARRPT